MSDERHPGDSPSSFPSSGNPATVEQYKSRLLDALGIAVVSTDRRGRIVYWNNTARELFGWSGLEPVGRDFFKITRAHIVSDPIINLGVESDAEHKQPARRIIRHHDKLGLPVFMVETDVFDDEGAIVGYVSVFANLPGPNQQSELFPAHVHIRLKELMIDPAALKPLSGVVLSVCGSCLKIEDDDGIWQPIDEHLKERFDADFSHSVCPQCARQMYPELFNSEKAENR